MIWWKNCQKMKQNEINGKDKGDLTELSLFGSNPASE